MSILTITIRLVLSVFLSGIVGLERATHHRPAGIRTHILVCIGSTLIMLVSIYIYLIFKDVSSIDPSRIAANVVTGIGFLGAGTIIQRSGGLIKGLTTAASLWTVAGIGLAIGVGYYIPAIITTFIAYFVLYGIDKFTKKIIGSIIEQSLEIKLVNKEEILKQVYDLLEKYGMNIRIKEFKKIGDETIITVLLVIKDIVYHQTIITNLFMLKDIKEAKWSYIE